MFTGLIQCRGKISALTHTGKTLSLTCQAQPEFLADYKIGDSMAINGVCLTAIKKTEHHFTVELMPETFRRTTFAQLKINDAVNLEKALVYNGRIEGHFVAGHVDTTVRLLDKKINENASILSFTLPPSLREEIIPQGSVAINGVSLTVINVTAASFTIGLIPHSKASTNLDDVIRGQHLNLETDMIGKYFHTISSHYLERKITHEHEYNQ